MCVRGREGGSERVGAMWEGSIRRGRGGWRRVGRGWVGGRWGEAFFFGLVSAEDKPSVLYRRNQQRDSIFYFPY